MDSHQLPVDDGDFDPQETAEWVESLEYALDRGGPERVQFLMDKLEQRAHSMGVHFPFSANTPYINTIHHKDQPSFPGRRDIERRIKSIIRWNAMAMVVRANMEEDGIGGHISTYASAATLYEIGFNHFFHAKTDDHPGDIIYYQGHASPGIYARAFVEGRLSEEHLVNFRRELREPGGLSSYPHPWLMPDFWQFPTVSMGLAPIMGIYQARFSKYLTDRGIQDLSKSRVWVFMGDGETDEPESLGAITLASREKLSNLTFVINCNLQRLDGPVRGNGKIIQELEAAFRGAGWNVIKVIWGDDWDPLLEKDESGLLVQRMNEVVDGQYQKYAVEPGGYTREHFFGKYAETLKLVEHLSDEKIARMRRGGHDPAKVYAAYKAATEHRDGPTVILAKTIKGYGMGEAGEGKNVAHQQKKLNVEELVQFRNRFSIPLSDEQVAKAGFYKPQEDSPEMKYLRERREALGGTLPVRQPCAAPLKVPKLAEFDEYLEGSDRPASTTMVFVRILSKLLRDKEIGRFIVPIIPDEARTFGMEPLFRQAGIYAAMGQLYEPVDRDTLLYYKEAKDGQILEEGINEAGSISSFIAAGTSYSTHCVNMVPFFIYYSMFGFQRVGDLIWAAADMRTKGFLLGGTAGRTTLNGEGLQHEDGNSHILASTVPTIKSYDPAFAYEVAVIVQDGLRRMYGENEEIMYYVTLMNEPYEMPHMPKGAEEGIRRGIYQFDTTAVKKGQHKVQLLGSGTILREVIRARDLLSDFGVAADIWSVPSYNELRRDALACERWNRLNPGKKERTPYVLKATGKAAGPFIAASDYMKSLPEMIAPWLPSRMYSLGTDGFGRSDSRAALRRFFEVDAECVAATALYALHREGKLEAAEVTKAIKKLGIDPAKADPWVS